MFYSTIDMAETGRCLRECGHPLAGRRLSALAARHKAGLITRREAWAAADNYFMGEGWVEESLAILHQYGGPTPRPYLY